MIERWVDVAPWVLKFIHWNQGLKNRELSTIYRRYFGFRAIPTRFLQIKIVYSKNREKIDQYRRYIADISVFSDISDTKCRCVKKKKQKKKQKKPTLADISAIYRPVSASVFFFVFF